MPFAEGNIVGRDTWFKSVDKKLVVCPTCKTSKEFYPSDVKRRRRFCSKECAYEAHVSRPNKRRIITKVCPSSHESFETIPSDTDRTYCSNVCRGSGMKNPLRTKEQQFYASQEWLRTRNRVYRRDEFRCRMCGNGKESGKRVAHHLDDVRNNPENDWLNSDRIVTLCIHCHNKIHGKVGGRRNEPVCGI